MPGRTLPHIVLNTVQVFPSPSPDNLQKTAPAAGVPLPIKCSCHQTAHQLSLVHSDNACILLNHRCPVRADGPSSLVHALVQGGKIELGAPTGRWQMIVVYRGKHCPVSKNYLASLQQIYYELDELGVEVIAVSGDGRERAEAFVSSFWLILPTFVALHGVEEASARA